MKEKLTLEWDADNRQRSIIEYRQQNRSEAYPDNPTISDESIQEDVLNDPDLVHFEFVEFIEYFQELINKVAYKYKESYYWTAEVTGLGWRNQSGRTGIFYEEDSSKILEKILPDCDCNYKILMTRTGFKLQNFHHDSPVGNERYEVRHITNKEFLKSEFS